MNTENYDLMFIDPADDRDHTVLSLSEPDRRIVAIMMLSGPSARPLHQQMIEAQVSLDSIVDDYIEGLRRAAGERNLMIREWVRVVGRADAVTAITRLADELPGSRILLPDQSEAIGSDGMARLAERFVGDIVTPRHRRVA
jgi:hypothetical protein